MFNRNGCNGESVFQTSHYLNLRVYRAKSGLNDEQNLCTRAPLSTHTHVPRQLRDKVTYFFIVLRFSCRCTTFFFLNFGNQYSQHDTSSFLFRPASHFEGCLFLATLWRNLGALRNRKAGKLYVCLYIYMVSRATLLKQRFLQIKITRLAWGKTNLWGSPFSSNRVDVKNSSRGKKSEKYLSPII